MSTENPPSPTPNGTSNEEPPSAPPGFWSGVGTGIRSALSSCRRETRLAHNTPRQGEEGARGTGVRTLAGVLDEVVTEQPELEVPQKTPIKLQKASTKQEKKYAVGVVPKEHVATLTAIFDGFPGFPFRKVGDWSGSSYELKAHFENKILNALNHSRGKADRFTPMHAADIERKISVMSKTQEEYYLRVLLEIQSRVGIKLEEPNYEQEWHYTVSLAERHDVIANIFKLDTGPGKEEAFYEYVSRAKRFEWTGLNSSDSKDEYIAEYQRHYFDQCQPGLY